MAKRKTDWTEEKIQRYIKQGRGRGELKGYVPWLKIQDFPSRGRVHRVQGNKTERIHHLFSDMEARYCSICDWAENVVDIREQFPMDREQTLAIAEELGIKHPMDQRTGVPIVMTSDFFLVVHNENGVEHIVRTIKGKEELSDRRVIEKFEIERCYWERWNVDWGIVTEAEMPKTLTDNLAFLKNAYHSDESELLATFLTEWPRFSGTLLENLNAFDEKHNLDGGTGVSLYRHALARRYLLINMLEKIDLRADAELTKLRQDVERQGRRSS